jgi:hypothetical protein
MLGTDCVGAQVDVPRVGKGGAARQLSGFSHNEKKYSHKAVFGLPDGRYNDWS